MIQPTNNLTKMRLTLSIQMIDHRRRLLDIFPAVGFFTVEYPERVELKTLAAITAQVGQIAFKIFFQRLAVRWLAFFTADGIYIDFELFQPKPLKKLAAQLDHSRVKRGVSRAERLDAGLMELALAPRLRPLVAKHRAKIIDLEEIIGGDQIIFQAGPYDRSRRLGAQGQTPPLAVGKCVHLFLDDIGRIADRAGEDIGRFKDRRADLAVVKKSESLAAGIFDKLPERGIVRQNILCPSRHRVFHGLIIP